MRREREWRRGSDLKGQNVFLDETKNGCIMTKKGRHFKN